MTKNNQYLGHVAANRMREAIANKEDLLELLGKLFERRELLPEMLSTALDTLIDSYLAGRAATAGISNSDPVTHAFLNGSKSYILFEMLDCILDGDLDHQLHLAQILAQAIQAMQAKGYVFGYTVPPSTPATPQQVINIEVQPAPVTVNNAFASKAIQIIERDSNDEIVATTTTYQ